MMINSVNKCKVLPTVHMVNAMKLLVKITFIND